jgi:hypothetical protein
MKTETIEKILNFLEEKEGMEIPLGLHVKMKKLKLIEELENHPDDTQYNYEGDLDLTYSKITKLPNYLYVKGDLYLWDCKQLTKLPDGLLIVKSTLSLSGCAKIIELPDNLYVGQSLIMIGTSIEEIPDNLYVNGDIYIYDTPLAKKYTDEEIYKIVASTGGKINGRIIRK